MTSMTRAEVEKIVAEARAENKTPNLQFADLRDADLRARTRGRYPAGR
ncbi:hypothetical protein ACQXZ0_02105 [Corynebacterium diphtheriae]